MGSSGLTWRREFKAGAVALGALALICVGGAAMRVPGTSSAAQIADATGPGVTYQTYQVSSAAQRDTLSYWTTERMWAAATGAGAVSIEPDVTAPKGIPSATKFAGSPTTGALFYTTGGKAHFCSASAVDSTVGDLLLTAAHCVYEKTFASNVEYVPEYHDGQQPYGAWPVRTITVAGGWQNGHNVNLDFAFLAVAPRNGKSIEQTTGALTLGINLSDNQKIEVIGHNDTDNAPVRCAAKSFWFRTGQKEFYCHGFWTGTSGGPWIIGWNAKTGKGTVFGVIGGYEGGGDYEWASYSAYFGDSTRSLYQEAERQPAPKASPTATSTRTVTAPPSSTPTSTPTLTTSYSPTPLP
jgi:hypothetical protein